MQNDNLKLALQEIINYLQYIGNEDVNVSRTELYYHIYNTAISALSEK